VSSANGSDPADRSSPPLAGSSAGSSSGDSHRSLPGDERYEILAEIGRGASGVVYRARDRETHVVVALKILGDADPTPALVRRSRRELQAAWKVTHPGIVRIHDLARVRGHLALSMELVEGETLELRLKRKPPLTAMEISNLATDLARALAAAHREGVTHRDLKPANLILRASNGRVVITDLGISRLAEANASVETSAGGDDGAADGLAMTREGALMGTPLYMAPEQLFAQGDVGPRADVYAFGVILYEAATGKLPHSGRTILELRQSRLRKPPPLTSLPPFLARIIDRALSPDPHDRFADGGELRAALAEATHRGRMRTTALGVAALLALALVGGGLALRARHDAAPAPTAALPAAPSSFVPRIATLSTRTESLSRGGISSDGRTMAIMSTRGGPWGWWLVDLPKSEWRPVPTVRSMDVAPNARFIDRDRALVLSDGKALWRVPVDGSAPPVELAPTQLAFFDVTPDGRQLLFAANPSDLSMLDLATRKATPVYHFPDAHGFFDLSIAADGQHVLITRFIQERSIGNGYDRCVLVELDLATHQLRAVPTLGPGNCEARYVPGEPGAAIISSRRGGTLALWKIFLDGKTPVQLTSGIAGDDVSPLISPDGTQLYYVHDTSRLQLFVSRPHRPWSLVTDDLLDHDEPAFDKAGKHLWSRSFDPDQGQRILTVRSGADFEQIRAIPGVEPQDFAISSDGDEAVVIGSDGNGRRVRLEPNRATVTPLPIHGVPAALGGISWSSDRTRIALARQVDPSGVFSLGLDGSGSDEVYTGAAACATFSPTDPNLIAALHQTAKGWQPIFVDLHTRKVREVGSADGAGLVGLTWSPSGDAIYYPCATGQICRAAVKGGAPTVARDAVGDQLLGVAAAGDGTLVAASVSGHARLLVLQNLRDAR
jgi:Tol biopolymer transport system component